MSSISNLFKFIKDYPYTLMQPATMEYSDSDDEFILRYNIKDNIRITIVIGNEDEYAYIINTGVKWLPGKEEGKVSTGLTAELTALLKIISTDEYNRIRAIANEVMEKYGLKPKTVTSIDPNNNPNLEIVTLVQSAYTNDYSIAIHRASSSDRIEEQLYAIYPVNQDMVDKIMNEIKTRIGIQ